MDIDNLQQNLNTRVVFKEPRGMIRWCQLLFALIALLCVVNFETKVGVNMECKPNQTAVNPPPVVPPTPTPNPNPNSTPAPNKTINVVVPAQPGLIKATNGTRILQVVYPFDFAEQNITSVCENSNFTYKHPFVLDGSPEFFVVTGSLSMIFCIGSLVVYLLFSNTYHSIPLIPVVDLTVTILLTLFWFICSMSFAFGVSLLKNTVTYEALEQSLCQSPLPKNDSIILTCKPDPEFPSWRSLDVGVLSGFTSFFIWLGGIWFVFKETHFHQAPEQTYGP